MRDADIDYRRIFDRLSPAEIAILLGQDPDWHLPAGTWNPRQRMEAAIAFVRRDGIGASFSAADEMGTNELVWEAA